MKKLRTTITGAAFLAFTGAASAANVTATVDPVYDWSGAYVVASIGGVNQRTDFFEDYFNHSFSDSAFGAIVGGGLGYNVQQESVVFGLEADISFLTGHTSEFVNTGDYVSAGNNWAAESEISALGTLRGRIGYAVGESLFYATGGLAYGRVHNSSSWPFYSDTTYDTDKKSWEVGWVLGGGVETAISESWTLRAEGLYVDLGGSKNEDSHGFKYGFGNTAAIGKLSVSYRF